MRYVYIALVVLVTLVILTFKVQNLSVVTVSFLGLGLTLPVSLLVIGVYFLGMVTGSTLISAIRGWVRGAKLRG